MWLQRCSGCSGGSDGNGASGDSGGQERQVVALPPHLDSGLVGWWGGEGGGVVGVVGVWWELHGHDSRVALNSKAVQPVDLNF